jgi:hypothetical protein
MSTSSERALRAAATATNACGAVVNPRPDTDRAQRLAVAEAAATQVIEAARQEAANTAAVLRQELERQPREPSRSSECRRRIPSPSVEHRRGSPAAIQMVYKDSGTGMPWTMLTKTNYNEWSSLMKVKMQACQLWDAIEYADLPYHDEWRALEAIIAGVPPEMGASLADKASVKEAWDSTTARIGVNHVCRATLQ